MNKLIRIGTRASALALWQAHTLQDLLNTEGYTTELIPIKSDGDLDLVQPLYEMGTIGVFTKTLDAALLNNVSCLFFYICLENLVASYLYALYVLLYKNRRT